MNTDINSDLQSENKIQILFHRIVAISDII
jgi:hypothetical protein